MQVDHAVETCPFEQGGFDPAEDLFYDLGIFAVGVVKAGSIE
jgi:hypothetical protein